MTPAGRHDMPVAKTRNGEAAHERGAAPMSDERPDPETRDKPAPRRVTAAEAREAERKARLAAALRENLRRRKAPSESGPLDR